MSVPLCSTFANNGDTFLLVPRPCGCAYGLARVITICTNMPSKTRVLPIQVELAHVSDLEYQPQTSEGIQLLLENFHRVEKITGNSIYFMQSILCLTIPIQTLLLKVVHLIGKSLHEDEIS